MLTSRNVGTGGAQGLGGELIGQVMYGIQGPPGPKGEHFTYEDFTEEQLAKLVGPVGPQGPVGETGPRGATGPQGLIGPQGPAGANGKDYVLTDADKEEIAEMAAGLVEIPDSGGNVDEEQIAAAVNKWLDEHPEATTTTKWSDIADGEIFELSTEEEPTEPVKPVPCTGITLDKTELAFSDTETTVTLVATVTPFDTTDQIEWSVDNGGVATVENGVVRAIANGSCVITATCGAYSATCSVTVSIVTSATKANLDGYWDFVNVEDGYTGIVTNKADSGTLQGEVVYHKNGTPMNPNHYGGIVSGEMLTGRTDSYGGFGHYDGFMVTDPNTGIFYSGYPYSVEFYGALSGIFYNSERTDTIQNWSNALDGTILCSSRINAETDVSSIPDAGQRGVGVWYADENTIKTGGAVGAGNNTIALDSAVDVFAYHHYVVCVDSSLVRVYLDGVKVGEGTAANQSNSTGKLAVIAGGKLKMVRVYNAILTDEQVANNYANTIAVYGGDA